MSYPQRIDKIITTNAIPAIGGVKEVSNAAQAVSNVCEISKAASDSITANAKAAINIQRNYAQGKINATAVAKDAIDPSLDYLRTRILENSGVYNDDSIDEMMTLVKKAKPDKLSKFKGIEGLNIENFALTTDNEGVRGASLFSKKGRKAIAKIKNYGVKRVIDLRVDGDPVRYKDICAKSGVEYAKIPIAYDTKWTQSDIDLIPDLIENIKKGDYYIGCATGTHRTDTALALNYFFSPEANSIPKIEAGVTKEKMTTMLNKIFSTVNGICYSDKAKTTLRLSDDFIKKLGWNSMQEFLEELAKRKTALMKMAHF